MVRNHTLLLMIFAFASLSVGCHVILDIEIRRESISDFEERFIGTGDDSVLVSTWSWEIDDSIFAQGNTIRHTFPGPGNYKVILTGRNGSKFGRFRLDLTIHTQIGNMILRNDNDTCLLVHASIPTSNGYRINWGDGYENQNLSHLYLAPGRYLVTASIGNVNSGTRVEADSIYVGFQSTADFVYSHVGLWGDFVNQSRGAASEYQWIIDNHDPIVKKDLHYEFEIPDFHTVTLIARGTGCTADTLKSETIFIPPATEPFIIPFEDRCECEGAYIIDAPRFVDQGYTIEADCLAIYGFPAWEETDTVNTQPTIEWQPIRDAPPTVVVITQNRPRFQNGSLLGVEVGDWIWSSDMSAASPNSVAFREGRRITGFHPNGNPITEQTLPPPLNVNTTYYWLIYCFDNSGSEIAGCSRIHPITTE